MSKFPASLFFCLLLSCSSKKESLQVDDSKLYGSWHRISTTYYSKNDIQTVYNHFPADSASHISFLNDSKLEIEYYGSSENRTYIYTPANFLLTQTFAWGKSAIDTVNILTANRLILHVNVADTISFAPFQIQEFLRVDSLER